MAQTLPRKRACYDRKGARVAPVRALTAWLMAVAMLLQLTATAACAGGGIASSRGSFPICHASHAQPRGVDDVAPAPERKPTHAHDTCPFCSTCCHAVATLPPTISTATAAPFISWVGVAPPSYPPVAAVRLCPAASPRGPPARA